MKNEKLCKGLLLALWLLMLAAEVTAVVFLIRMNMIPATYLVVIGLVLALVWAGAGALMFLKQKSPVSKGGIVRRVIAGILAVVMMAGCGVVSNAALKVKDMIDNMVQPSVVSAVISVYVLQENAAQELKDAADYTFGTVTNYDTEGTEKAIGEIEELLEKEIAVVTYDSVPAMVNALYGHEVDAMILNSAYVTILEDIDIYADFEKQTRVLHEVVIYEEPKPTEPVEPSGGTQTQPSTEPEKEIHVEPFIMYISGSDTRNQLLTVSRSDVNILVIVNPQTHQILMVNTPRDAYIPNPAGNGALDKLTHCGIYGIDCSVTALSDLYGQQIDHYAQINFTGFETLIDAVGGVTVYSDVAFTTNHGNYSIQVGNNELNGSQALAFARERYALKGGDKDRGKNQMKVIAALIDKLSSTTIITNYAQILDSLKGMFTTDLSEEQISQLVKMQLSEMPKWEVFSYAITGTGASEETYSMPGRKLSVWNPNADSVAYASELMSRVLEGQLITAEDIAK